MLFLVYFNDLASVSKYAATILFADDTNAIYEAATYDILIDIIQKDLIELSDWFKANKLALNESKTKFIIFHTRNNKPPKEFTIILNDVQLERVDNIKFLGVFIQENLLWNTHINHICNRVSKATSVLARLKHYLPKYALKVIYNSLCLSHISYALIVWGAASVSDMGRLQKLHKKGIRHVCNAKYNSHTEPLFKKENILQLSDLFKLQCVKLVYKRTNNTLHCYHASKLKTNFEITQTNTRKKDDINITKPKTTLTKINSLNYKIGSSWNQLDSEIRIYLSKTLQTFTRHVKRCFLSQYQDECKIKSCYICNR